MQAQLSTSGQRLHQSNVTYGAPLEPSSDLPPTYDEAVSLPLLTWSRVSSIEGPEEDRGQLFSGPALDRSISSAPVDIDDELMQHALEFTHHAPPARLTSRPLPGPIAIPQVSSRMGMPFCRAYAPILSEYGITMAEFTEFIDNLNIVSSSNPPLQMLDLAGGVVGMLPFAHSQIVATSIQAGAKLGNVAVMKTRGAMFVNEANARIFNPRGLKLELVPSKALRARLSTSNEASSVASTPEGDALSLGERKLMGLRGHVAPLTFDVPPPNEPTNMLDKFCAKQQATNARKLEEKALRNCSRNEEQSRDVGMKLSAETHKLEDRLQQFEREREDEARKRDEKMAKVHRRERKERKLRSEEEKVLRDFERENQKIDRDIAILHRKYDREQAKSEGATRKGDKDGEKAEKGLWILIEKI